MNWDEIIDRARKTIAPATADRLQTLRQLPIDDEGLPLSVTAASSFVRFCTLVGITKTPTLYVAPDGGLRATWWSFGARRSRDEWLMWFRPDGRVWVSWFFGDQFSETKGSFRFRMGDGR